MRQDTVPECRPQKKQGDAQGSMKEPNVSMEQKIQLPIMTNLAKFLLLCKSPFTKQKRNFQG
jgi:hypothetical protein